MKEQETDLFGEPIIYDVLLRDKFLEPPFSVLDTKQGSWQKRKRIWQDLGMKSEVGRDSKVINMDTKAKENNTANYISIFDPALCEVLYHWFCPEGGAILDPFAGGSVRGIVANYLNFNYTGLELRQEQVDSNREQALDILPVNKQPNWYVGDSEKLLDGEWANHFDFIFSCPPYANLEVYSDHPDDLSTMEYRDFLDKYNAIISKSCKLLESGGYACFVVGEVRDKKGNYIGFVPDTIKAFMDCDMEFYNEAILLNSIASASMRANGNMKSKKLAKVHQNVLVFKKP
jgi:DNA modification methylase